MDLNAFDISETMILRMMFLLKEQLLSDELCRCLTIATQRQVLLTMMGNALLNYEAPCCLCLTQGDLLCLDDEVPAVGQDGGQWVFQNNFILPPSSFAFLILVACDFICFTEIKL